MVYILCWLGFEYAYGFERVSMCLIHFSRDFYCSGILFKFAARSLPVRTFSLTFTQTEASKRFVYLSVYLYESVHIVTNTHKYICICLYVIAYAAASIGTRSGDDTHFGLPNVGMCCWRCSQNCSNNNNQSNDSTP